MGDPVAILLLVTLIRPMSSDPNKTIYVMCNIIVSMFVTIEKVNVSIIKLRNKVIPCDLDDLNTFIQTIIHIVLNVFHANPTWKQWRTLLL